MNTELQPRFSHSALARISYCLVVLLTCVALTFVHALNKSDETLIGNPYNEVFHHYMETDQYDYLADALLHGRLWLNLPVSNSLASMDDPYDFEARISLGSEDNPIFWDHAFYQGKYYCYFGVVPAVIVFAPYQLLFHRFLTTPRAALLLGVLATLALSYLALELVRTVERNNQMRCYMPKLVMVFLLLVAGSNVFESVFASRIYAIPVLASVAASALGISFWLKAKKSSNSNKEFAKYLFLGSFFMMLNLGCRPQFMLGCLLAFPLFWKEIVRDRILFSKRGGRETAAALIPIPIVAAPLLMYNYCRFGSIFDFGAFYNLTGFDMTDYVMTNSTFLSCLYSATIQPIDFCRVFPFVRQASVDLSNGWAPADPMFGGYFCVVPTSIFSIICLIKCKAKRVTSLKSFGCASLLIGLALVFIDCKTVGVSTRYFGDFGFYISLSSSIGYMLHFGSMQVEKNAVSIVMNLMTAFLLFFSALVFLATLFVQGRYDGVYVLNASFWNIVRSLF